MKGKKLLAGVLSTAMVLGTMALPAFADETNYVTIGNNTETYDTLLDAINATKAEDVENNVITYNITGKVSAGNGYINFAKNVEDDTTIVFAGTDENAELALNVNDANGANIFWNDSKPVTINVKNLICSREGGVWIGNAAQMNQYFSICANGDVTYTDCVFPDGAGAGYWKNTTFSGCTFKNDNGSETFKDTYGLWFRGVSGNKVTVKDNCVFDSPKGIKTYSDDQSAVLDTEISDTTFNCTDSPAIIASNPGTITATDINVDNCAGGVARNDKGAEITVDGKAPAYTAVVDGKLYTDKTYAEKEAADKGTTAETIVAMVGNKYYATIDEAVEAAQDGDTITILGKVAVKDGDLPSSQSSIGAKTLTFKGADENSEMTFVDGTGEYNMYYAHNSDLTFEDLTITWKDHVDFQGIAHTGNIAYKNCTINGQLTLYGAQEKFEGCHFVQAADDEYAYNIWTWGASESEFKNCKFTCRGKSINVYGGGESTTKDQYLAEKQKKLTIDNCEFYVENKVDNCDASAVVIKTKECPYDITIKDSTAVGFVESKTTGSQLYDVKKMHTDVAAADEKTTITVNENSVDLTAVKEALANGASNPSDAKPVIKIALVKNDAASTEDSHVYDIKVVSDSDINKLNSTDLTFSFVTDKANEYAITAAENVVLTNDGNSHRYMFSYKNGTVRETAKEITIGQATVTGYGKYTLKVDDSVITNVVNATTLAASLVDSYVTDDSADGKLDIADSTTDENGQQQEIKIPTRKLSVKIYMNNKVADQKKAYQAMKVDIAGGDYSETIALGSDAVAQAAKVYTVEKDLPINTAYTVTVSGAGYRTARYTVNLTSDKTLNFWNNVADNAIEVELGNEAYKKDVTFLAGDIVKDGTINIYDLSAVVSYFGTINNVDAESEYAKYDLNRDGKIDSKDVAYVLVSWGK